MSAWRKFTFLAIHNAPSEESDQTARMHRLLWIFAGSTCEKVLFPTWWLQSFHSNKVFMLQKLVSRIRPNYRTVRLGFSKLLGTLICGKICIYLLRIHYIKKKIRKGLIWWWLCDFFSDFLYKGICCGYSFELHRHVDAIQMSTHNICLYKEVKKKNTGCNLKTTKFLDCSLIGVCAVIRSIR